MTVTFEGLLPVWSFPSRFSTVPWSSLRPFARGAAVTSAGLVSVTGHSKTSMMESRYGVSRRLDIHS
ncbi:hypothetical protein ABGB17_21465 [Sphaerisporangium sp. B11E5]|uniref:hypothetical protein n=1 Tax=Sphaerisporangium sp. B11E5 TaxID=3153563 RepID=UPI00325E4438